MPPAWLGIAGGNPDLLTAAGGEGEGLSGSRPSGPHPGSLREPVPLPQAGEGLVTPWSV